MADVPTHSRIEKVADTIFDKIPRTLIGLLLLIMVGINLANVIGRHVFGQALFWSEEIMTLLLVWCVYLGAAIVTYRSDHLRMDLFSARLRKPLSMVVNAITFSILIAVTIYIATYSYQVVQIISMTGRVSNAAKYPLVFQHIALFFGLIFIIAAALARLRFYSSGQADR